MEKYFLVSYAIAFVTASVFLSVLKPLAFRIGLVDNPGGRKRHEGSIPLIGGVAMFLGFMFAVLALPMSLQEYRGFLAGATLLLVTGVLDDFHEITARNRLVLQIIAAILMTVASNNYLTELGNLFFIGDVSLGRWGIPFTIVAVVGIINAINMLDGLDGLAGSVVLVALCWLTLLAVMLGRFTDVHMLLLVILVLIPFLYANFPFSKQKKASIFMGDAGSMFLGFILVWFLISLSETGKNDTELYVSSVTMLWIILVPLYDMGAVIVMRFGKGRSPLLSDRRHFHHLLRYKGYSVTQSVLFIAAIALLSGATGVYAEYQGISESIMFAVWVGLFLVYLLWLSVIWKQVLK